MIDDFFNTIMTIAIAILLASVAYCAVVAVSDDHTEVMANVAAKEHAIDAVERVATKLIESRCGK